MKTFMKSIQSKQFKAQQRKMKFRMDEDDEDDSSQKNSLYTITHAQQSSNHFIVRIHSQIGPPSEYASLFNLLDNAGEDDYIVIDINSVGGHMDTAVLLRRAILSCDAHVTARIGITCASAATVIALAADSFELDTLSTFHIHTASLGLGFAKVNDLHAAAEHNIRLIDKFVRQVYEGFLSEDELESVLNGKEMYMSSDDLSERLEGLIQARQEEMEEDEGNGCGSCDGCEGCCCEEEDERSFGYTMETEVKQKEIT